MLEIDDATIDQLAAELAALARTSKIDAVRIALQNEIARVRSQLDLVEASLLFARQLRSRGNAACARHYGGAMLCTGDDFAATDLDLA